ncbi:MAG: chorismate-binding protein, partial [Alteromonadaceae bacterium]|nr:chorismate-binding protein [Alteromonadaceae bacterium]
MPVPASSRISRKDYERLLAHAAKEPDFVYLGSPGPGNGRGSLNGFTACAIATKCMTYTPDETLNTGRLAEEMEDVVRRYAISEQESNGYLCGGWVGFLSYEFGHSKEKHLLTTTSVPATPLLHAGFYLWATSHNRATDTFFLWVHPQCPQHILSRLESWLTSPPADAGGHWEITAPFKARQPVDEFKAGVGAVLRYIDAGDCYQANLSQEFQSRYTGNPWHGFQALTKANPTPYSAFIKAGAHTLLSASPERFLEVCEGTV